MMKKLAAMQERLAKAEKAEQHARQQQLRAEEKRRSAERQLDSSLKLRSSLASASDRAAKMKTVDVCFVVDITQSMDPYLNNVRQKIVDISHCILRMMGPGTSTRFGFVGYRDYDDDGHLVVMDFNTDVEHCRRFLGSIEAKGGGDWCEDVVGGLEAATKLDWTSKVRMLYLISGTPNHGSRFHSYGEGEKFTEDGAEIFTYDDHRNTKDQWKIEDIMKRFLNLEIKFICLEISASTARMFEVFERAYNKRNRTFVLKVLPMTASPNSFASSVAKASWSSIESSWQVLSDATRAAKPSGTCKDIPLDYKDIDWAQMYGWEKMSVQLESFKVDVLKESGHPCERIEKITSDVQEVRIAPKPFGKGAMRYAYAMWNDTMKSKLVAKVYMCTSPKYCSKDVYEGDMMSQAFAKYMANEFNKKVKNPLQFVQAQLLSVVSASSRQEGSVMCVEPYMPGKYVKQTNNSNYVGKDSELAQAFSHFTWHYSGGDMMVTDIQGVRGTLTDPQIHCAKNVFGRGNLGTEGMDAFFMVHKCGETCKHLRLKENPLQLPGENEVPPGFYARTAPGNLASSAYTIRKTAAEALTSESEDADWIAGLRLAWPKSGSGEPVVIDVHGEVLVHVIEEEPESGGGYSWQARVARLRTLGQVPDGEMLELRRRGSPRRPRRTASEKVLEVGFSLIYVGQVYIKNLTRLDILQLLAEYRENVGNCSLVFAHGDRISTLKRFKHLLHKPGKAAFGDELDVSSDGQKYSKSKGVEDDADCFQWLCGGKCGSYVTRRKDQYKASHVIPSEVFCRKCTLKVNKSWRGKQCATPDCQFLVTYREFVCTLHGVREPDFCKRCDTGLDRPIQGLRVSTWRRKKCEQCKSRIDYTTDGPPPPAVCEDCTWAGQDDPEPEDLDTGDEKLEEEDEKEWEVMDYTKWKQHEKAVQKTPQMTKTCSQCNKDFLASAAVEYQCQTGNHKFIICESAACQRALAKLGEDLCKQSGKAGKKHLDFAKHRGKYCCPRCMLVLTEI